MASGAIREPGGTPLPFGNCCTKSLVLLIDNCVCRPYDTNIVAPTKAITTAIAVVKNRLLPLCDDEDGADDDDGAVDDDDDDDDDVGMFWNVSTMGVDDVALDASKAP